MTRTYGLPFAPTDTSYDAAESVRLTVQHREQVCEAFFLSRGVYGATADEFQAAVGWSHQSASPRVSELARRGVLVDSGERRLTRSKRKAAVYVHREWARKGKAA